MGQKNKLKKPTTKKKAQESIRIIKQLNANLFEGKQKKKMKLQKTIIENINLKKREKKQANLYKLSKPSLI
jgi:hypothetical protein